MKDYHYIWLENHRNRTEEWLRERLADGFDIHHADGDHGNNEPSNLILIECTDHMRLHGSSLLRLLGEAKEAATAATLNKGKAAYDKKTGELSWLAVGRELNPASAQPASWARSVAKQYAETEGLPFPKPGTNIPSGAHTRRGRSALLHRMEPYS